MAAILSLLAAGLFGVADFFGGVASRNVPARVVAGLTSSAGLIVAIPILLLVGGAWSTGAVVFGALAGLLGALGLVSLFAGLSIGPFQLVSPVSAMIAGIVPVGFGVAAGERPGSLAILGLLLAPPAVWILAGGSTRLPDSIDRRALGAAVAAGVSFGFFFVALDASPDDAGFLPVVVAKFTAVVVLLGWNLRAGIERPALPDLRIAFVSGVFDMAANGAFLAASTRGDLSTVGALVSLYPAANAVLAAIFLGERLQRLQAAGFGLAIGAGVLLAV